MLSGKKDLTNRGWACKLKHNWHGLLRKSRLGMLLPAAGIAAGRDGEQPTLSRREEVRGAQRLSF